jgi:hypothetical protein
MLANPRGGEGAHPCGLGVRNARNAPRPNPEACPAPRRTPVQAQPHRLRSKRDATRRPGAAGGCGAALLGQRVRGAPRIPVEFQSNSSRIPHLGHRIAYAAGGAAFDESASNLRSINSSVGAAWRCPSHSCGPPRLAQHPRSPRPRSVHIGVGWVPPLQKAGRNGIRPRPDPYKGCPD